ncbi:MAG: hypothetical protein ACOZCL_02140 [Bacillota bacterium]
MSSVKVNINMEPPVRCYQMYAYPLSIIFTNVEKALPWFYSNFINLKICVHNTGGFEFMDLRYIQPRYELCEIYDSHNISQDVLKKGYIGDLHRLLKEALDDGYAVSLIVDEFYVCDRIRYQKEHKRHQILVCGYNDIEKKYDVVGYDSNYTYAQTRIDFSILEEAFYRYEIIDNNQDIVILMRKRDSDKKACINTSLLQKEVKEYLNSTSTLCPEVAQYCYMKEFKFGLEVFGIIKKFISLPDYNLVNYPLFYMIHEHKTNFYYRMDYVQRELRLDLRKEINSYNDVKIKSKYILSTFLKYMLCNNSERKLELSSKLTDNITEMVQCEELILHEFLNKICD